jgi:membrane protease YdiL (CAAX protease family)
MLSPIDHGLALLVGLMLPLLSSPPDDELRERLDADREARRKLIRNVIVSQWAVAWLCLWRVEASFGGLGAVGLGAGGREPGLALAWGVALAFAAWRVLRVRRTLRDPGRRARELEVARAAVPFLPREQGEGAQWVWLSLTAGFCEEVTHRGFLLVYLWTLFGGEEAPPDPSDPGSWAAALAVTASFAAAHRYQGLRQMAKVTGVGVILAAQFVVGGSLWPGILLHMFVDLHGAWSLRELGCGEESPE